MNNPDDGSMYELVEEIGGSGSSTHRLPSDTPTYDQLSALCAQLAAALDGVLAITQDSTGVAGYHLNGNVAEWDEFEEIFAVRTALTAYRTLSPDPQWQRVPEGCVVVPVDLLGEVAGTLEALNAQTPTKSCQATIVKIYELVERARGEG